MDRPEPNPELDTVGNLNASAVVNGIKQEIELNAVTDPDLIIKVESDHVIVNDTDSADGSAASPSWSWSQQLIDDPEFSSPNETNSNIRSQGPSRKKRSRPRISQRLRKSVRTILKVLPEAEVYRSLYAAVALERIKVNHINLKPNAEAPKSRGRGRPRKVKNDSVPAVAVIPKRKTKIKKPQAKTKSRSPRLRSRKKTQPEDLPQKANKNTGTDEPPPTKGKPRKIKTHYLYDCDDCDKTFARSSGLKYHRRSIHGLGPPIERKYQCKECSKTFIKNSHLIQHEQAHTGEGLFKCRYCEQSFRGSSGRKFHELSIHEGNGSPNKDKKSSSSPTKSKRLKGEKPVYTCNYCAKPFPRMQTKIVHERTHTGEKPYLCTLCGITFRLGVSLREHNKTIHTGERDILCAICGEGFSRKMCLKYHMVRKHSSREDWFKCEVAGCNQAFVQKQKLDRHVKRIHSKGFIQCIKCMRGFDPKDTEKLKKHMDLHELRERRLAQRKINPPRPRVLKPKKVKVPRRVPTAEELANRRRPVERNVKCTFCTKMFSWPSDRHRHEQLVHRKQEFYPCDECEIQFKSIYRLWTHNKEVHNQPGNKTKKTRIREPRQTTVPTRHRTRAKNVENPAPAAYIPPPFQYANWTMPENQNTPIAGHSAQPQVQCLNTGKVYEERQTTYSNPPASPAPTSESNNNFENDFDVALDYPNDSYDDDYNDSSADAEFQNVVPILPKKRGPPKKPPSDEPPKKRPLAPRNKPCKICGKLFRTNQRVNEHIKIHSKPVLTEPLPCPDCNLTFKSEYSLTVHRVIHDPKLKPFPCKKPNCNESFGSTVALMKHSVSVHPDPNSTQAYVCEHENCGHSFKKLRLLKQHLKTHDGTRNFACSHAGCNLAFRTSSLLKRHTQIHIADADRVRPFKCEHCDKTYIRHDGLKQHLESYHRLLAPNHQPFSCQTCFKTFEFKWNLRTHIRRIHKNKRNRPLKNPEKPPAPLFHTCETCDWGFESGAKLKKHYLIDHQKRYGHNKYECPKESCEKFYYLWKKLKIHIMDQHEVTVMEEAITRNFGDKQPPESEDEQEVKINVKRLPKLKGKVAKPKRPVRKRRSKRKVEEKDDDSSEEDDADLSQFALKEEQDS